MAYGQLSGRWCMWRVMNSRARLLVSDVYAIRRRAAAGEAVAALATEHGVSPSTVRDIVAGHSWMRLPPAPVYWKPLPPSPFWSWWVTIWIFLSLCGSHPLVGKRQASQEMENIAC